MLSSVAGSPVNTQVAAAAMISTASVKAVFWTVESMVIRSPATWCVGGGPYS